MLFQIGGLRMKINYYPDTDSLYIDLSSKPGVETIEISEGVVVDYDSEGQIVGIDIDNAGVKLNLKELILNRLPVQTQVLSA